ncbi:hypothetical protein HU200_044968 [Digitaria exilis]|uniref:Uncharacterized protein n=1 Tax=Digitaria exilis TaxID=1010633 RepID=A0A835EG39_9POAL|nr:hypothetical protein HU200_044968 [Digitaria exilis]CAB3498597.1 unnamed protein product [Digitaria exilis]
MASSYTSSQASPNPIGLWFCQISSGLQGTWSGGRAEPQQQQGAKHVAGGAEARQARAPEAKKDEPTTARTTCRRDAMMSETTVYLLLDRFAPS